MYGPARRLSTYWKRRRKEEVGETTLWQKRQPGRQTPCLPKNTHEDLYVMAHCVISGRTASINHTSSTSKQICKTAFKVIEQRALKHKSASQT